MTTSSCTNRPPDDAVNNAKTAEGVGTDIEALQRENRILKKQLKRANSTLKDMEALSQRRERMLRESLRSANNHLHQAQAQVVQSEKFSTLGELVAGVAHEINNPISCITNNVGFLKSYGEQLMEHIEFQTQLLASAGLSASDQAKLEEQIEDIELEYIVEDLPNLTASIATSAKRIQAISQSLRTFARADTQKKQSYSLHEGIDGTLLILRHRLKSVGHRPAIAVTKTYGNLPNIDCYPGQINQVFMNILANAIDAMEAGAKPSGPPAIQIVTAQSDDKQWVEVSICDNAGGMPEAVRDRIFERQFTTKEAGKGTGLGLSIAYEIVTQNHTGAIDCQTDLGIGTCFTVRLPIEANATR